MGLCPRPPLSALETLFVPLLASLPSAPDRRLNLLVRLAPSVALSAWPHLTLQRPVFHKFHEVLDTYPRSYRAYSAHSVQ